MESFLEKYIAIEWNKTIQRLLKFCNILEKIISYSLLPNNLKRKIQREINFIKKEFTEEWNHEYLTVSKMWLSKL